MISPLGPNWSVFLGFHEQIRLNNCPEDFKPAYFRGHVDDIFALFCSSDHLGKWQFI